MPRAAGLGGGATNLGGVFLGIDTSIGTAVAVIDPDGVVRAERVSDDPLGHAEAIGTLLAEALADATVTAARGATGTVAAAAPDSAAARATAHAPGHETTTPAVTHVAVGMGPGPFTGLRIGIAAARAFALARALPVVPVVGHDAVALGILLARALADADPAPFAVVTDARRRELAYTVYDGLDDDGLPIRATEPALAPRDEIDARLAALGAERRDTHAVPAALLALAAARAVAAGRTIGPDQPLYLRSPDVTAPRAARVGA